MPLRGNKSTRRGLVGAVVATAVATLAALSPVPVMGAYSSSTGSAYSATIPEAVELSGLTASPTYPNWYWTHSDVWKSTDAPSACVGLAGADSAGCQQVQRARLWALRIDPVTHAIAETRSFALNEPGWALDPFIAQNNDWEDIAVGPARANSDGGGAAPTLVIAATGNALQNRVMDANGQDITCDTRRLIELREPNLSDPAAVTWNPWKIYDVKNIVGIGRVRDCNVESLMVSTDSAGQPTAYMVTKASPKLFTRTLDESTGRSPETPPAAAGSDAPYRPAVSYSGNIRDTSGLKITSADVNGAFVSLLVPKTAKYPGQILSWPIQSVGLGATLTGYSPVKSLVSVNNMAEGLAYTRNPHQPGTMTNHLMAISDAKTSKFPYYSLPDG